MPVNNAILTVSLLNRKS